jgi:hypothetical protein
MADTLEKLAELVRRAEMRATSARLETELKQLHAALAEATERNTKAQEALRSVKPQLLHDLENIRRDEEQLEEYVRKAAQFKAFLDDSDAVERLITESRNDLQQRRQQAQAALNEVQQRADAARRELQEAARRYQELRERLGTMVPLPSDQALVADQLLQQAVAELPSGQLLRLEEEVDSAGRHFGELSRGEQFAQLKIWIGRLRRLQALDLAEAEQQRSTRIFTMLVGLSKTHEPGYIDAFRQEYRTDWDSYIAAAEAELRQAIDARVQRTNAERLRRERQQQADEKRQEAQQEYQQALRELKALLARCDLPHSGVDEFLDMLRRVVAYGSSDPELLELVAPYRELIAEGSDFRALRRNLERYQRQEGTWVEEKQDDVLDLLPHTRGKKVVLIGGARREEVRRQLEGLFEFDRLEWEDDWGSKPAMLNSLEQRVRNRTVDLVVLLRSYISHQVSERFRPLCEQYQVPCVFVDQGYGVAQISRALRSNLLKRNHV